MPVGSGRSPFRVTAARDGFTLIELLVVVAIIAVLMAILLPSLQKARDQAKATVCAANQKDVGIGVQSFNTERGFFPPSYVYPDNSAGFDITQENMRERQSTLREFGYQHWSYYLYNKGQVDDKSFQCPAIPKGGHPRTYPGPDGGDWEGGQVDGNGAGPTRPLADRQARRMALTANAAIMPRNKFNNQLSEGPRVNRFVRDNEIKMPGRVILATEFAKHWRAIAVGSGGSWESKSHRPVQPFYHTSSSSSEYGAPPNEEGFRYDHGDDRNYGLLPLSAWQETPGLIDRAAGDQLLNAVGRHHPGGDELGGAADFLYVDGHVERKAVRKTIENREWGDNYYSISGNNRVVDRYTRLP